MGEGANFSDSEGSTAGPRARDAERMAAEIAKLDDDAGLQFREAR
jgi:hypothetical protein